VTCCSMVWACCWRSVDTRTYNATRISRPLLCCPRRPTQHQLVGPVPPRLPVRLFAGLPPDLEGAPHGCPLHCRSLRWRGTPAGLPLPQRPPPPVQTKLAMTSPAELVTCDQTIEHTVRFAKQTLGWTTLALARPSRPTAGPGWCWPHTPSCAWPARSWRISGCRGSGPDRSRSGHPCGSAGGSATSRSARLAGRHAETLRTLPGPAQGQPIRARHPLPGHQEVRHQAPQEGHQDHQGRLTAPSPAPQPSTRSAASPARRRVKSQAKRTFRNQF
jgi:hypothetical protein